MGEHSRLFSPSGSHTWLPCIASALLNADKPRTDNVHSLRGTMLHSFCEVNFPLRDIELVNFQPLIDAGKKGIEDAEQAKIALMAAWELEDLIDDRDTTKLEFNDHVPGMPDCHGTIDLVMHGRHTRTLLIGDYKFGYNEVDPRMNPQFLIYALIVLGCIGGPQEIDKIILAVIQPRISRYPVTFELSIDELLAWVKNELLPKYDAIQLLDKGLNGSPITVENLRTVHEENLIEFDLFAAGEHQCQWCKSKLGCPELEGTMMEVIPHNQIDLLSLLGPDNRPLVTTLANEVVDTSTGEIVQDDLLAKRLKAVPLLRLVANAIEEDAMRVMKEGGQIPGFKLIRGRANRKWKDEDKAARWLAARGFKEKERYDFKVKSVSQAEKLLKGMELTTKLSNSFAALIEKPLGELTYAPEDDKRPGVVVDKPNLLALLPVFDDDIESL